MADTAINLFQKVLTEKHRIIDVVKEDIPVTFLEGVFSECFLKV